MQVYFTTFGHQTSQLWIVEDALVTVLTRYSEVEYTYLLSFR